MNIINQKFVDQAAARHLSTKSLRYLASAIIQQAVLDYRALVRRGVIVRGKVHWPHRSAFAVDNMTNRAEAETAQAFFAPGGDMENLIHTAALDLSPEFIRREIKWTGEEKSNSGLRLGDRPSRETIRRNTVKVLPPLSEYQIETAIGNYAVRRKSKSKDEPARHDIDQTSELAALCRNVAEWYGTTLAAIHSIGRKQPAALARQVCMYLFRNQGRTDTEIGAYFGRDRTCVYESVKKIRAVLQQDSEYARTLKALLKKLDIYEAPPATGWLNSTTPALAILPAAA